MGGTADRPLVRSAVLFTIGLLLSVAAVACGADRPDDGSGPSGRVVHVPGDQPTVQAGVDAAHPGDLVLVAPGTYAEQVVIDTPRITVRGTDRNTVVLDGGDTLTDGITVVADGVTVENLTVHGYTFNGIVVNGAGADTVDEYGYGGDRTVLDGYRVRYVTAYDNGLYGIYAFSARNGEISDSLTSGHPDSGIYVGQCKPCNVVIHHVVSERNAIGYYGTNASGQVYVVESVFRRNRLGLTPNSQQTEELAPQSETVVAGNLVIDNDDPMTPEVPGGFFGGGIVVGGGTDDLVVRNRVEGHSGYGIGLVSLNRYDPEHNRIVGNVLADNTIDLHYGPRADVVDAAGNCFADNVFSTSSPANIETVLPCTGPALVDFPVAVPVTGDTPAGVDYRTIPAPPPQPSMPSAATAPVTALPPEPEYPDIDAITVPDAP